MAHNLFGAGYSVEAIGKAATCPHSAAAIWLASMFFAFRLRGRFSLPQI